MGACLHANIYRLVSKTYTYVSHHTFRSYLTSCKMYGHMYLHYQWYVGLCPFTCVCVYMWTMDLKTHRSVSWLLMWTHLCKYMQIYLLITHRLYPSSHTGLYLVMYRYVWSYTGLYFSTHRAKIYHTQVCSWTYVNLGILDEQLFCFMWHGLKSLSAIQLISGLSRMSKMISLIWMVP